MLQGISIIVFMLILIILMVTRKCPTLVAIPALALGIAIIGGLPLFGKGETILGTVIQDGSLRLASAYTPVVIATWLGSIMAKTGITETMIRKAAELGGDKTLFITILLYAVTCALSSTMSGLGAVIMIGTIVIPILISVGVDKFTAGAVMVLAYGTGEHWGLIRSNICAGIFKLDVNVIYSFSLIVAATTSVACVCYILYRYYKGGRKFAFSARIENGGAADDEDETYEVRGIRGALSMFTPFLPILVVVLFKWPVVPSFLLAIVWSLFMTSNGWRKTCNLAAKTCYEGFLLGAPCAALMIFIGMLLVAINAGPVKASLEPLINAITPTSRTSFILLFVIATPLVLYRGPLNLFGLGAGIAALMAGAGVITPMMVCVGFLGVAAVQDTSCPTNTHNVWAAGFVEEDVTAITKRQLPYVWAASAVAIIIGAFIYWPTAAAVAA